MILTLFWNDLENVLKQFDMIVKIPFMTRCTGVNDVSLKQIWNDVG